MYNNEITKLVLSPSSNIFAYKRLIEHQERITKSVVPAFNMSESILKIARYYENLNKINKNFQIPHTISKTIKNLMTQNLEVINKYSQYYNQLNDVVKILNPSLALFLKNNSTSIHNSFKSLNDIDLGIVNSFDSVNEDYDESVQAELKTIKTEFDNQIKFKEDITQLINESTSEITTDIYLKFSQIIEKYVGIKNARTIGLFLNIILTTYFILIPLYQDYLSSESEDKQTIQIEDVENRINSKVERINTEIQDNLESLKNETHDLQNTIKDKSKNTDVQIDKLNEKLDKINNKLENDNK